eukprot:scaffold80532_cov64-Phaeocystis_antarctica.AAC.3
MGAHGRPFQVCLPGAGAGHCGHHDAGGQPRHQAQRAGLCGKQGHSLSPPAPVGRGWPTLGAALPRGGILWRWSSPLGAVLVEPWWAAVFHIGAGSRRGGAVGVHRLPHDRHGCAARDRGQRAPQARAREVCCRRVPRVAVACWADTSRKGHVRESDLESVPLTRSPESSLSSVVSARASSYSASRDPRASVVSERPGSDSNSSQSPRRRANAIPKLHSSCGGCGGGGCGCGCGGAVPSSSAAEGAIGTAGATDAAGAAGATGAARAAGSAWVVPSWPHCGLSRATTRRSSSSHSAGSKKTAGSSPYLWCHDTRYVRHARGWYVRVQRTYSRASPGPSCRAPLARAARRRLVRVARTYSTEAPGAYVSAPRRTPAPLPPHPRPGRRSAPAPGLAGAKIGARTRSEANLPSSARCTLTVACHLPTLSISSTYVENKGGQTSASWLSGGPFQRQAVPQATPSFGQPRPISRLGRAGRPYRPCFPHSPPRAPPGAPPRPPPRLRPPWRDGPWEPRAPSCRLTLALTLTLTLTLTLALAPTLTLTLATTRSALTRRSALRLSARGHEKLTCSSFSCARAAGSVAEATVLKPRRWLKRVAPRLGLGLGLGLGKQAGSGCGQSLALRRLPPCARSCLWWPRAPASLGQSAGWAAAC